MVKIRGHITKIEPTGLADALGVEKRGKERDPVQLSGFWLEYLNIWRY